MYPRPNVKDMKESDPASSFKLSSLSPLRDVNAHVLADVVHVALVGLEHVEVEAAQANVGRGVLGRQGGVVLFKPGWHVEMRRLLWV